MCTDCGCETPLPATGLRIVPEPRGRHQAAGRLAPAPNRRVIFEHHLLSRNQEAATGNRQHFQSSGIRAINLLSSPGAGKTTLLEKSLLALHALSDHPDLLVIEGDQQTRIDADRIRSAGGTGIQINTGHGCHLDAGSVRKAFDELVRLNPGSPRSHDDRPIRSLLFIENIGNLVCPALWDLGEECKVVVLSVAEGDDKPLKYPDMFSAADLVLINKIDLMAYTNFDLNRAIENCRATHPGVKILPISATRGDGLNEWLAWLTDPSPLQQRFLASEPSDHSGLTQEAGVSGRPPEGSL